MPRIHPQKTCGIIEKKGGKVGGPWVPTIWKVHIPYPDTFSYYPPMFELYVAKCSFKNKY